jgi:Pyruvate/2-oxoacid:ferredoxin oxidoreductase delta subunit
VPDNKETLAYDGLQQENIMMKKKYKSMSKGLGIVDWIKRRVSVKESTLPIGRLAFRSLVFNAPLTKIPVIGTFFKKITLLTNTRTTQGYSIPLNIDVSKDLKPVTVPIDLMKKAVREATYRAAMNTCICRDAYQCMNYPHDLGCIFLGKGAKICIDNGIAHEATVEQCIERIDKAASFGLPGQSYWIEVEGFLWGFQNEDMDKFLELCFCCSCCCAAEKFMKRSDSESRLLFQKSIGYVANVESTCTRCGECISCCPRLAIKPGIDIVEITEDCGGCGICIDKCPSNSLKMILIKPLKSDLKDYFEDIDLKL